MIGYVTLGTNDLARASAFYDALLAEIGGTRMMASDRFVAWGGPNHAPGIGVTYPFDGKPATVGNGVMVALEVKSTEEVDRFYAKAMALGATDEGKPGYRMDSFYAGYFRDLDGNKLNVFWMKMLG
jgi:catechol 2,3-dioxygenase-like lactoylglutathione lyase family enzyme